MVTQGSITGPFLYQLHSSDIFNLEFNTIATFADDTAILAIGKINKTFTVQTNISQIDTWTWKWRIKSSGAK